MLKGQEALMKHNPSSPITRRMYARFYIQNSYLKEQEIM